MSKTQTERVLALSKRFNGVCQADLLLPDVADGGTPITRVAARLWDLEQEGHEFEAIGTRKRCKVFRLASEPTETSDVGRPPKPTTSSMSGVSVDSESVEADQEKPNTTTIKLTDGDAYSHPELDPEPLFKVGKAELGYADQGELDAA